MKLAHIIEDHAELLLRQIHPSSVRGGRLTSEPFNPSKVHAYLLSVNLASKRGAADAFEVATARGAKTIGVLAVTVGECANEARGVHYAPETIGDPDGTDFDDDTHAVVDFADDAKGVLLSKGAREKIAQRLRDKAKERGYLHPTGAGADHEVGDCSEAAPQLPLPLAVGSGDSIDPRYADGHPPDGDVASATETD